MQISAMQIFVLIRSSQLEKNVHGLSEPWFIRL